MKLASFGWQLQLLAVFVLPTIAIPPPIAIAPSNNFTSTLHSNNTSPNNNTNSNNSTNPAHSARAAFIANGTSSNRVSRAALLQPIDLHTYKAVAGMQDGTEKDISNLKLKSKAHLMYGRPSNNDQVLLANLTLFAPPGLKMITTERFEHFTSTVDCKGDKGAMSIAFKSMDAMNKAWESWHWINAKKEDRFLMIANTQGCGPDYERQPYLIYNVKKDKRSLACSMKAEKVPWAQVADSYDLEFGKASASTPALRERGWGFLGDIAEGIGDAAEAVGDVVEDVVDGAKDVVEDVTEAAGNLFDSLEEVGDRALDSVSNFGGSIGKGIKDVFEVITGNININKGANIPLNLGKPKKHTALFRDKSRSFNLDCVDCYVAGSFKITGKISVKHFVLRTFTLSTHPQNLRTTMELQARVSGSAKKKHFESTKEIVSAPIPGLGLAVPGIFKLGLVAAYNVGFEATASGNANVNFGFKAKLADSTGVTLDLRNPSASSAKGFQGATFTPIFEVGKLTSDILVTAKSEAELTFGIELVKVAQFDVALKLNAPEVNVAAKAGRDDKGFCSRRPGASKTGAKVSSSVGVSMDFELESSFLGSKNKPLFDLNLFRVKKPIFSKCFPLKI